MTHLQTLCDLVGGQLRGNGFVRIDDVASLEDADGCHITFIDDQKRIKRLLASQAGAAVVGPQALAKLDDSALPIIIVDDPQAAFIRLMQYFRPATAPVECGLSSSAHIAATASLGADCHVHPTAVIGENATVGDRCHIFPGAIVGEGCTLGDDVVLHPHAVLYPRIRLGDRVTIHATAVIGKDGFGFRFEQGTFVRIPQLGTVLIEDDVEIGAGTTIDRAMIGATVIGAGTKLDNQIQIAHNCRLGQHNAFAAQVGFAGSITTGDYVRCAGQAGVADHAHLGTGSTLGAKAGVHGDVPAGETWHGCPAGPEKEAFKLAMAVRKVPDMRQQLRALQKQVAQMQAVIESLSGDDAGTSEKAAA